MTRGRSALVLAAVAAAVAAMVTGAAAAHGPGVVITSISPTAASRGASVTLTGGGFGPRNAQITVGGVPAEVLSITDGLTFRVPGGAPSGQTTVRVTKPDGKFGEIGFRVLSAFDGEVRPAEDAGHAAGAVLGPDGGSITAGPVTLTIPAGALLDEREITVTPLSAVDGSPLGSLLAGAKLEPQGLHFVEPATLSLSLPQGVAPADVVGFGFDGQGTSFHLAPRTIAGGTVTVSVRHFSGAGAATATPAQVAAALAYTPTAADQLYSQHIAAALYGDAQTGSDPNTDTRIDDALDLWFVNSVLPNLTAAKGGTEAALGQAAGEWLAWEQQVQLTGRSDRSPFAGDHVRAVDQATTDAADLADRALGLCNGSGGSPLSPATAVGRVAAVSETLALPIETKTGPSGRQLPPALDLAHACFHVTIGSVDHPDAFAIGPHNTVRATASVQFWTGASRSDLGTVVDLQDATQGAPQSVGSDTTTSGSSTIAYTGSSSAAGHRFFRVHASLAGAGAAFADDERSFDLEVRPRVDLQSDATVRPGDALTLQLLLAGDGMANAPVSYALSGTGSLGQSTGTTGQAGTASVGYTAAGANQAATDTVTASFDDGHGTATDSVTITVQPRITVTLTPSSVTVAPSELTIFTATVTGTADQAVTWTTTDPTGAINLLGQGDYIAGTTPGTYTVTARSVADPSASGSATVHVRESGQVAQTTVKNEHICADFLGGCIDHNYREDIELDGTASVRPDGSIVVTWQSGDASSLETCNSGLNLCPFIGHREGEVRTFVGTLERSAVNEWPTATFIGTSSGPSGNCESCEAQYTISGYREVHEHGQLVGLDFASVVTDGDRTTTTTGFIAVG